MQSYSSKYDFFFLSQDFWGWTANWAQSVSRHQQQVSEPPVSESRGNGEADSTEYDNLSMMEPLSQNTELYELQINSVWESWMWLPRHIEMFVTFSEFTRCSAKAGGFRHSGGGKKYRHETFSIKKC